MSFERVVSDPTLNPRQIEFISPPDAKDQTNPRGAESDPRAMASFMILGAKPYAVSD